MNSYPEIIIVRDQDGGYILAKFKPRPTDLLAYHLDESFVPVYEYIEYYHDLESAIKDAT